MTDGWFDRLKALIEGDKRSYSQIARAAGLGRNFVQQMLKDGKEPGADKLGKILSAYPEAASIYVLTGLRLDQSDLEFLEAIKGVPADAREDAYRLLRRLHVPEAS